MVVSCFATIRKLFSLCSWFLFYFFRCFQLVDLERSPECHLSVRDNNELSSSADHPDVVLADTDAAKYIDEILFHLQQMDGMGHPTLSSGFLGFFNSFHVPQRCLRF